MKVPGLENYGGPKVDVKKENIKIKKAVPDADRKKLPSKVTTRKMIIRSEDNAEKNIVPLQDILVPEQPPRFLQPKGISFGHPTDLALATMPLRKPPQFYMEAELSDLLKVQLAAMRRSEDREILSTEHLGLTGLQMLARLSGKRLTARKGNDGMVRSVSYNSRLIAFSIPVNR
jgi:hypothetical protein